MELPSGSEIVVKLKNRRVSVIKLDGGEYGIKFRRLLPVEERKKPDQSILVTKLRITGEALVALSDVIHRMMLVEARLKPMEESNEREQDQCDN